ncbi:MAG: hypothetical protein H7Z17_05360 [Fuerstia sp.]|nr:hypothetical protein [Fuerstiella sp.]
MTRVLLPNLFFEEELQSIAIPTSPKARQLVAEIGPTMGLLAGETPGKSTPPDARSLRSIVVVAEDARPDDLPAALQGVEFLTMNELAARVALEPQSDSDQSKDWEAVPWGWSHSAAAIFKRAGLRSRAPDINVVRSINSRQFQSTFDAAIEIDGTQRVDAFGTLCRSPPEVTAAIQAACEYSPRGWVIKADLSHASRNRLLGSSTDLRSEHRAWLETRFASGECVYVEPWMERISECGLQFFVPSAESPTATIEFIGAAEMLTDAAGRYRGSIVRSAPQDAIWQPAIDHCLQIAKTAASKGYFGPLGIDCMVFRCPKHKSRWLRLSHDINGRLTMGRVALSLRRFLEAGETGFWVHDATDSILRNEKTSDRGFSGGVRIVQTSPGRIGGKAARMGTAFVVSADSDVLRAVCTGIPGQSFRTTRNLGSERHS